MAHRLISWSFLSALVLVTGFAHAQQASSGVSDPTRPPAGVSGDSAVPEAGVALLQSILIPKKGKPIAVIGGQQVRLGEKYGESRLVRLTEREAVLEGPAGVERLMLTPGIEKTNITTKNVSQTAAVQRTQRGSKP